MVISMTLRVEHPTARMVPAASDQMSHTDNSGQSRCEVTAQSGRAQLCSECICVCVWGGACEAPRSSGWDSNRQCQLSSWGATRLPVLSGDPREGFHQGGLPTATMAGDLQECGSRQTQRS